jgi:hypothetical protein
MHLPVTSSLEGSCILLSWDESPIITAIKTMGKISEIFMLCRINEILECKVTRYTGYTLYILVIVNGMWLCTLYLHE